MPNAMRFRLITLLAIVAVASVAFALFLRPSQLEMSLRKDLGIPPQTALSILESSATRVIAVKHTSDRFELFAAFTEPFGDTKDEWSIPIIVASGAPDGEPEVTIEYLEEFDHFPTTVEIGKFRDAHGLRD